MGKRVGKERGEFGNDCEKERKRSTRKLTTEREGGKKRDRETD